MKLELAYLIAGLIVGFVVGSLAFMASDTNRGAIKAHTGAWTVHEWTDAQGKVHYIVEKAAKASPRIEAPQ